MRERLGRLAVTLERWAPEGWSWKPTIHKRVWWVLRTIPGAVILAFYALLNIDRWRWRRIWQALGWVPRNYFSVLAVLSVGLAYFWLWFIVEVAEEVLNLLDQFDAGGSAEDRRNLAYAFGVNIAALAGLVAAPLVIIRAWVSERHTKTAEEGLITERFTRAVEQLGAEKTVKRRELKPKYRTRPREDRDTAEDRWLLDDDGNPIPATRPDGTPLGKWETLEETVPNLEVRLGAIYALERIAQDSERDHIPIMETLCAYVRENAPASGASDHGLGDWPDWPEDADDEALAERARSLDERGKALWAWVGGLEAPRVDIQAALSVIGRRTEERLAHEERSGFRLDLRRVSLQGADLTGARLMNALFSRAQLAGAVLRRARLEGAGLDGARLEGADLSRARLEGAVLNQARLERAVLSQAWLEGAVLSQTRLERAVLIGARLEGAGLFRARLEEARLSQARLQGARLIEARLEGAVLRSVNLQSADLSDWTCARTSLRSADFTGARGLTQEHINAAFGDSATKLPEGLAMPDHWDDETIDPYEKDKKYRAWLDAGAPAGKPRSDRA